VGCLGLDEISIHAEENISLHFTYARPEGSLKQGDILSIADASQALRRKFNATFGKRYSYFIVLTQSCDLVVRSHSKPKIDTVSFAPLRSLNGVLRELVDRGQKSVLSKKANVCNLKYRDKVADFLDRLLQNNEGNYFFLHHQIELGFPDSMCALLRSSRQMELKDSYEDFCKLRVLSLNDEFRPKLGWLVGQLYSRVATRDWDPSDIKTVKNEHLNTVCGWVDSEKLSAVEKKYANSRSLPGKVSLRKEIESFHVVSKADNVLERVSKLAMAIDLLNKSPSEIADELCRLLRKDNKFKQNTR